MSATANEESPSQESEQMNENEESSLQDGQRWGELCEDTNASTSDGITQNSAPATSRATPVLFTDNDEEQEVPLPLRYLIASSGACFVRVDDTWNVDGYAAKLKKSLSVTFTCEEEITGEDILDSLDKAGLDTDNIVSIQRRNSNRTWVVSFTDQESKDQAIAKGKLSIKNSLVFIGDADLQTVVVKIFEAPQEMPDTVVIGHLAHFGRVLSFRRDISIATGIQNGVRTARMRLTNAIPCTINVAGESLLIKYPMQPKTCRRCGGAGHFANSCRAPRCYNCDQPGHRADACEESALCGICFASDHPVSGCPYLLLSANVQPGQQQPTYAEAAKEQRKKRPAAEPAARSQRRSPAQNAADKSPSQRNQSHGESQERDDQGRRRSSDDDRRRRDDDEGRRREDRRDDRDKNQDRRRDNDDEDRNRERRRRRRERSRDRDDDYYRDRDWDRDRDRSSPRDHYRDSERGHDRDRYRDRGHHRRRDLSPGYDSHRSGS